jgi:hypothetical protein
MSSVQARGNLIELVIGTSWLAWIEWMVMAASGFYVQIVNDKDIEFTKARYVESWS